MPLHRFLPLCALIIVGATTTGCGLKGPLYLPDEPQKASAPQAEHNKAAAGTEEHATDKQITGS